MNGFVTSAKSRVPLPFPLSVNVTPDGSAPDSESANGEK
jgi:hypothetical protein